MKPNIVASQQQFKIAQPNLRRFIELRPLHWVAESCAAKQKGTDRVPLQLLETQMGKGGFEPPRLAARDPKSRSSANSDTSPGRLHYTPQGRLRANDYSSSKNLFEKVTNERVGAT